MFCLCLYALVCVHDVRIQTTTQFERIHDMRVHMNSSVLGTLSIVTSRVVCDSRAFVG
jgi:hypothetical protein